MELIPLDKNAGSHCCTVGNILQNGVRIEKHQSLLLRLSCIDIVRVSDWDLKQSIRKLDSTCSIPIYESIDRITPKRGVELHLIYENSSSVQLISSKIELLMSKVKANGRFLDVEIVSRTVESSCTKAKKVLQAVWLRNLPIRWFELDTLAGSCAVPITHILRMFLVESFGEVLLMETRNQNSEKENFLRCDICLQFAGDDGRNKMMNAMSDGSCVAKKEGSEAVFPIAAEFDLEGYFDIRLIDQRIALRGSLLAAQQLESKEVEHLNRALCDAEIYLNETDVVELLDLVAVKDRYDELSMLCNSSKSLERNSLSAFKGNLEHQISMSKDQCRVLRAASAAVLSKSQSLTQIVRAEQVNRKLLAEKEARELTQMHIKELQSSARHSVDFATENSRLGKLLCLQNKWENIPPKLFPRMDILTANLSQLLKKEGGADKYANMLQKSQTLLEECLAHTAPLVTYLEQYSDLLIAFDRAESALSIDGKCDSSLPKERSSHPVANTAKECVESLISVGAENMRIFLSGIRGFEVDVNITSSKEQKDSTHIMSSQQDIADMAHAVNVLRGVYVRLLDAELTTRALVDSYSIRIDVAQNKDDSDSTHGRESVAAATTVTSTEDSDVGASNSTATVTSLSNLRLPESAKNVPCLCFKGSCICDSQELQLLHGLYRTEIVNPFELRISRISNMLRSSLETLSAPAFLTNLKNSVETACALSLIGAKEYEQDREALMKEAELIRVEGEREKERQLLIAAENVKRVKAEQRALLERKIAALKARKKELEEIEEEKERERERVSRIESALESQLDPTPCTDNSDLDHIPRERISRAVDAHRDADSRDDSLDRYPYGLERDMQLRQTECEKGQYVYALLAPSWDRETPHPAVPTMDRYEGVSSDVYRGSRNSHSSSSSGADDVHMRVDVGNSVNISTSGSKRCRMQSVVGCVVTDMDSGILSATRRKLNLSGMSALSGGDYRESQSQSHSKSISPDKAETVTETTDLPILDGTVDVHSSDHSIDPVHNASINSIAEKNKLESIMREALLASKLKRRLSARVK